MNSLASNKNWDPRNWAYALLIELLILICIIALIAIKSWIHADSSTSSIQLATIDEVKTPEPPRPKPRQVLKQSAVSPKSIEPTVQEKESTQSAFSEPSISRPTSTSQDDQLIAYSAKVKSAVQAAIEYPSMAIIPRSKNKVRVEFDLRDGVVSNSKMLISSGISALDRAAMDAIQRARYPSPPSSIAGQTKSFVVWVEFNQS